MPSSGQRLSIAIIEDDSILREELSHFLRGHGHAVFELVAGPALDELIVESAIDIVILDLNLPGESGFVIAKRVRDSFPSLGIIALSARTASVDRIEIYEKGADIYIPKPCPPDELLAAVQGLGRRVKLSGSSNAWLLDPIRLVLQKADGSVHVDLFAVDGLILMALARASQRLLSAQELCELIGNNGPGEPVTKRALENKISRLRGKFSSQANDELSLIRSVRGEGYQLRIPLTILGQ